MFDHPAPAALAAHVLDRLVPDSGAGDGGDSEEAAVRKLLVSVSLGQLREIGVLEPLLQLAGRASAPPRAEEGGAIDSMDVADLVKAALNGQPD